MSAACCGPKADPSASPAWRRALWIALGVNAVMFAVEIGAGIAADSRALQADALDFLGDAANYAISLAVAGMVLAWRARAALIKGATITIFGLYVIISTILGALAQGDSNMRSVSICSRNDVIGNVAVMRAALGVFGTGSAWPDLAVAAIIAMMALTGGLPIVRQARIELAETRSQGALAG